MEREQEGLQYLAPRPISQTILCYVAWFITSITTQFFLIHAPHITSAPVLPEEVIWTTTFVVIGAFKHLESMGITCRMLYPLLQLLKRVQSPLILHWLWPAVGQSPSHTDVMMLTRAGWHYQAILPKMYIPVSSHLHCQMVPTVFWNRPGRHNHLINELLPSKKLISTNCCIRYTFLLILGYFELDLLVNFVSSCRQP